MAGKTTKTEAKLDPKQKALAAALADIEKAYGKGAVMKLGETTSLNIEAISTGSLSLDMALGIGGLPKGRIIEVYGKNSAAKLHLSTLNTRSTQITLKRSA